MLTVITPATSATLATLAEVKAFLRITDTSDDGLIGLEIEAATNAIENWVGRPLRAEVVEEVVSFQRTNRRHVLERWPVEEVTSISFDSVPWAATDYQVNLRTGVIEPLCGGYAGYFSHGIMTVRYRAAFTAVPAYLRKAVALQVKDALEWTDREGGVKQERLEGVASQTYEERGETTLLPSVMGMVQHLRDARA